MQGKSKIVLINICRYFIAAVLLFSGISKIIDPQTFNEAMNSIGIMNAHIKELTTGLLPIMEVFLGVVLLFNKYSETAMPFVIILFTLFLFFAVYGILIGVEGDCGCFGGILDSSFDYTMVVRNFTLFLMSVILLKNAKLFAAEN